MKKIGRPTKPENQKRVRVSTTVSPETIKYIFEKKQNLSIGEFIDFLVNSQS